MLTYSVHCWFAAANTASAAGGILFFLSYVAYFQIQMVYNTLDWSVKMISCILPNLAMAFSMQIMLAYEVSGRYLVVYGTRCQIG